MSGQHIHAIAVPSRASRFELALLSSPVSGPFSVFRVSDSPGNPKLRGWVRGQGRANSFVQICPIPTGLWIPCGYLNDLPKGSLHCRKYIYIYTVYRYGCSFVLGPTSFRPNMVLPANQEPCSQPTNHTNASSLARPPRPLCLLRVVMTGL